MINLAKNLETRTEKETKELPIKETRTLEDGAIYTLNISNLNAKGLEGVEETQIVVEKVLKVELQRGNYPKLSRTSSPRRSWSIPEETYWEYFREPKNYSDAVKCIERINGKGYGWNRRTV